MVYKLRNFDNNYQAVSSLGWIIVLMSLVFTFLKQSPGFLILAAVGLLLILWQLRGKRVIVDTNKKTIKKGLKTLEPKNPTRIYLNEVKLSQRVNSRVSSTQSKQVFYKAYIQDGEESHVISSNRKEYRDLEALKAIAKDLEIEFVINY